MAGELRVWRVAWGSAEVFRLRVGYLCEAEAAVRAISIGVTQRGSNGNIGKNHSMEKHSQQVLFENPTGSL